MMTDVLVWIDPPMVSNDQSRMRAIGRVFPLRRGHDGIERSQKGRFFMPFKMKLYLPRQTHLGHRSAVFAEAPTRPVLNDSREIHVLR